MAEWGTVSMASMQPTIVSNDYMTSTGEYTAYGTQGMDDFVLDFGGGKTFVGELEFLPSSWSTAADLHCFSLVFGRHESLHVLALSFFFSFGPFSLWTLCLSQATQRAVLSGPGRLRDSV